MSDKKVLIETILPEKKPVTLMEQDEMSDEQKGDGFYYLKGLFIEGEVRNHNGRVYPRDEIARAVDSINERIAKTGPIPGELDHPEGLNINYERISHVITEMRMEGANGVGVMRINPEGYGRTVIGTIKIGMQPGVSSRGSGEIGPDGMVSGFDIVTVDIVANPSALHAYPDVVRESMGDGQFCDMKTGRCQTLSEWARQDEEAQRHIRNEINKFLAEVRNQYTWRK